MAYYRHWLKLDTGFYRHRKIIVLRRQKNGDSFFILFTSMLCIANNSTPRGSLLISEGVPYDAESLANDVMMKKPIVERGLKLMEGLKMIVITDGVITIRNWAKYQVDDMDYEHVKEGNRNRKQNQRAREKADAIDGDFESKDATPSRDVTALEKNIKEKNEIKEQQTQICEYFSKTPYAAISPRTIEALMSKFGIEQVQAAAYQLVEQWKKSPYNKIKNPAGLFIEAVRNNYGIGVEPSLTLVKGTGKTLSSSTEKRDLDAVDQEDINRFWDSLSDREKQILQQGYLEENVDNEYAGVGAALLANVKYYAYQIYKKCA